MRSLQPKRGSRSVMDLNVIQKRAKVKIVSFTIREVFNPPILDIYSEGGFKSADYVLINGVKSANVSILSDKRLLAGIPTGHTEITSLAVYTSDTSKSDEFILTVGMDPRIDITYGIDRVIQKVVKILLTSPGSSMFSPKLGAGLNTMVAQNYANPGELSADVSTAISLSEEAIIASEGRSDMHITDRLKAITILEVTSLGKDGVAVSLEIMNQAGETGRTSVSI
jgi:phage baseplate assembly protein W